MAVGFRSTGCYVSSSANDTFELGGLLAQVLQAGDVLVLSGDLGAGKTQLTKGLAQGLGIESGVVSPTFTIQMIHEHHQGVLYHFDLYRVQCADELDDIGLWEALDDEQGICILEWGERFSDEIGFNRVDIELTREDVFNSAFEPERIVRLKAYTPKGSQIIERLDELVQKTI